MIELKVSIDSIDYSNVIEKVLPLVEDKIRDKYNSLLVISLLDKLSGLSGFALKAALAVLPQDVQDDIAVMILQSYQEDVKNQINKLAEDKGIKISVSNIEVSSN